MGTTRRQLPLLKQLQIGKSGHEDHGRLADAKKQALCRGIGHAPARPARQVKFDVLAIVEAGRVQRRRLIVVADASAIPRARRFTMAAPLGRAPELNVDLVLSVLASSHEMLADPRLVTRISPSSATAPATPGNPGSVAMWRPASGSITSTALCLVWAMKTRRL